MKKNIHKLFLFLIILGSIFWLGGLNIRAIIGNEFFEKGTIVLRSDLPGDFERALILVYANSTIVTFISYIVVLISSICYLFYTRPKLKEKGWMMIAIILFFIFVPVEIYTGYLDLKYILMYFFYSGEGYQFRELLVKRVSAIGGLPAIAIFCYYSIIGILVWRPLNKKTAEEVKNEN
jgi:hypothetical protein